MSSDPFIDTIITESVPTFGVHSVVEDMETNAHSRSSANDSMARDPQNDCY